MAESDVKRRRTTGSGQSEGNQATKKLECGRDWACDWCTLSSGETWRGPSHLPAHAIDKPRTASYHNQSPARSFVPGEIGTVSPGHTWKLDVEV